MYTKQEIIIMHLREGKSQRQISQELGIHRKTVKRYIKEYQKGIGSGSSSGTLQPNLITPPKYRCKKRPKRVLTNEIQVRIDQLLESNKEKRRSGLQKQTLKKRDILEILHQEGHQIGYTTVCNYISGKEQRAPEAFIRQRYPPGFECEFDWGEAKLVLAGKRVPIQLAVFTASYSNYRHSLLFYRQDTLAFMESHVKFKAHINGVYHQMVYDNMRLVVARFVGRNEKEPTQALVNLKSHYQFHHRFCNVYRGNEKGHVERSVEYIRRKAFGHKDTFSSLEEAQMHLQAVVDRLNQTKQQGTGRTAMEMFNQEKEHLWEAPAPFPFYSTEQLRADKYATVSYCGNKYSVPDHLVGDFVEARVFSNQLVLYHQEQEVASHKRSYGAHTWTISLEHYLNTLHKKPGALKHSEALAQCSSQLQQMYQRYYQERPRDFVELLLYCRKHQISREKLHKAEQDLLRFSPTDINTEKMIALLGNSSAPMSKIVCKNDEGIQKASEANLLALAQLTTNQSMKKVEQWK